MYTHSPDPSKQYAILRKIRGSRDEALPGYFAPQEQIPWLRGCRERRELLVISRQSSVAYCFVAY